VTGQLELFGELADERAARLAPCCLGCGVDTVRIGDFYMLHDPVWLRANPGGAGMLCVDCVETRLGRRLEPGDFTTAPINNRLYLTPRLRSRILGRPAGVP
jgi:hypothetical protein